MKENHFFIAPEGWPFLAVTLGLTLGLFIYFSWVGALIPFALFLFCLWFFRDPKRISPEEEKTHASQMVLSPADGTIVQIKEVEEPKFLKRKCRRICVFMSPLNVHVNRSPITGEVKQIAYNPGKFFNASGDKASEDNEQNAILMRSAKGLEILWVQIAGFLARRIVCYPKAGDQLTRGQRMGLIRFGSRVDVYLPLDAEITVGMKQRVTAGETILARIPQ